MSESLNFPCKRHHSKAGERCSIRLVACAYRYALSVSCPKCKAPSGNSCVNLSSRRDRWQTWEPEPHRERYQLATKEASNATE